LEAISDLKTKRINFSIVTNESDKCVGILTLKQIFEKIVLKIFKDDDIRVNIYFSK
jgi:CBS domain containing-hemolysin-like protein